MVQANPYAAPVSDLTVESDVELGDPAVFSFRSRAGRLRYLARVGLCTLASYAVLFLIVGAFAASAAMSGGPEAEPPVAGMIVGYLVFVVASVVLGLMFATQRLHDLDQSGWMSLLMLVPLVNVVLGLYLLFARGTEGANSYGAPPPPNTLGVKLGALILPLVFVVGGIIAAIAIPAYQEYAIRAQQAEQFQLDSD